MGLFQDLWNKGIKKLVKAIAQGLTDENKESDVKELGLPIFLEEIGRASCRERV